MRLIDADKIKQSVTNEMLKAELNSPVYCTLECVIADIESQPTAYDVDKVVERLEDMKYVMMGNYGVRREVVNFEDLIEVVKSGGID